MIEIPIGSFLSQVDTQIQALKAFIAQEYGEYTIQQLIEAQQARQLLASSEDFRIVTPTDLDTYQSYYKQWCLSVQNAIILDSSIPDIPEECSDILKAAVFSPTTLNMLPLQILSDNMLQAYTSAASTRRQSVAIENIGSKMDALNGYADAINININSLVSMALESNQHLSKMHTDALLIDNSIDYINGSITALMNSIAYNLQAIKDAVSYVGGEIPGENDYSSGFAGIVSALADLDARFNTIIAQSLPGIISSIVTLSGLISGETPLATLLQAGNASNSMNMQEISSQLQGIVRTLTGEEGERLYSALIGSEGEGIASIVEAVSKKLPFNLTIKLSTIKADDSFSWGIE